MTFRRVAFLVVAAPVVIAVLYLALDEADEILWQHLQQQERSRKPNLGNKNC